MKCKKCNTEFEGEFCPNCATSVSNKAFYKIWWFWVIVGAASIFLIGMIAGIAESIADPSEEMVQTIPVVTLADDTVKKPVSAVSKYKKVTVDGLLTELAANEMRAENNYKDKYVVFDAVIMYIGEHGTIHVGAYSNSADTIECYVDEEYNDFLMNKSKGDRVKIKGKITHVSTTFGYTVDVDEISDVSN